jgi:hypothetical protein
MVVMDGLPTGVEIVYRMFLLLTSSHFSAVAAAEVATTMPSAAKFATSHTLNEKNNILQEKIITGIQSEA